MSKKSQIIFALGILLVVGPLFLKNWFVIPDFLSGIMMGAGIALEFVSVLMVRRQKSLQCSK